MPRSKAPTRTRPGSCLKPARILRLGARWDATALHQAVRTGSWRKGERSPAPAPAWRGPEHTRTRSQLTPLHWAAISAKDPSTIEALLAAGANIEARNRGGNTPLHEVYDLVVLDALLSGGAPIDARNRSGETVMHTAAQNRRAHGSCNVWLRLERAWRRATASGARRCIRRLTHLEPGRQPERSSPWERTWKRGTKPVTRRCSWPRSIRTSGRFEFLANQLAEGEMTQERYEGRIGGTHAAEAVVALLEAGANANARNAQGDSPWDLAQENEPLKTSDAYWHLNEARFAGTATAIRVSGGGAEARPARTVATVRAGANLRNTRIPNATQFRQLGPELVRRERRVPSGGLSPSGRQVRGAQSQSEARRPAIRSRHATAR